MRKKISKEQARDYKERFYKKQREQGLCLECMNSVAEGSSRCEAHAARRRELRKAKQKVARKKGLCRDCLSRVALEHNKCCADCYFKRTSNAHFGTTQCWEQLKEMFESQQGKCALSGVPLTLGLNTDLDHIQPLAKGGCKDVSNTQWVLHVVNRMKRDIPEAEFFSLIKQLYFTMRRRIK